MNDPSDPFLQLYCSSCKYPISDDAYFCSHCGKKLKISLPSLSILSQIGVYIFSFFLPLFGLIPAVRYLFAKDYKAKFVGYIAIIITIFSVSISISLVLQAIDQFNKTIDKQIEVYDALIR